MKFPLLSTFKDFLTPNDKIINAQLIYIHYFLVEYSYLKFSMNCEFTFSNSESHSVFVYLGATPLGGPLLGRHGGVILNAGNLIACKALVPPNDILRDQASSLLLLWNTFRRSPHNAKGCQRIAGWNGIFFFWWGSYACFLIELQVQYTGNKNHNTNQGRKNQFLCTHF